MTSTVPFGRCLNENLRALFRLLGMVRAKKASFHVGEPHSNPQFGYHESFIPIIRGMIDDYIANMITLDRETGETMTSFLLSEVSYDCQNINYYVVP